MNRGRGLVAFFPRVNVFTGRVRLFFLASDLYVLRRGEVSLPCLPLPTFLLLLRLLARARTVIMRWGTRERRATSRPPVQVFLSLNPFFLFYTGRQTFRACSSLALILLALFGDIGEDQILLPSLLPHPPFLCLLRSPPLFFSLSLSETTLSSCFIPCAISLSVSSLSSYQMVVYT